MSAVFTLEQQAYIDARIVEAVNEIAFHVVAGLPFYPGGKVPPKTLRSFSELHDYCDANELGSLCDDEVVKQGEVLFPERDDPETYQSQGWMVACEAVQDRVDAWLQTQPLKARKGWQSITSPAQLDT